jgi:hypothetical protein
MNSEQELLQKLMISKKIMEKHNSINRGSIDESRISTPQLENFEPVSGSYNIPEELMVESRPQTRNHETPSSDRILKSNLPDEIKQLMIEHPIQQPSMGVNNNSVLSEELVEKASRLMNTKANGELISEFKQTPNKQSVPSDLKSMIREVIEDVLRENGLITESETKSNETFKFRVGKHLFEGKLTKVKKIQQ